MIDKPRQIALTVLYKIDKENAYSNIALDEELRKNRKILNEKDIGLISEIVYGTTTWKLTLDTIIKKYSKLKIEKLSKWILNILRMGSYQIVFLDKIPKSAAVNESVNLAKRYGHPASANFVNAVLRKIDKKDYEEMFKIEEPIQKIMKTTSTPKWLIEELLEEKTLQEVEEICKSYNEKPNLSIRVNTLKTNKDYIINELKKLKINVKQGILEDFLVAEKIKQIEKLEIFQKGLCTIQDVTAGLVALVLEPKEGENILDACSAPGGKTSYLAQLMKNKGKIEAWDIHPHRTKLVEETAKRLGIKIIKTKVKDATLKEENIEKFDKILLDVPCLGTGVIRRKPDIKWKHNQTDIEKITKIQKLILKNCSAYLKEGGELVYSTCSILKKENEDIIYDFLEKEHDFIIEPIKIDKRNAFSNYCEKVGSIKVLPNENMDGFFICKLKKI